MCTRPRPILAAPTPEALPALANAGPMENDIEDMYYSPPAQSQDHRGPQPLTQFNQVINPVLRHLEQAQVGFIDAAATGKFLYDSMT